jgi:prepilin-type N-terminal cleavage/methylation domain-containing protein
MRKKDRGGFTLIELLIVIGIIALIATFVFVALNPLKRFQDSRNAKRWSDIAELMHAIKVSQVDRGGTYIPAISSKMGNDHIYMIGTETTGCDTNCSIVDDGANCVDLSELVGKGYLGQIPVSPKGDSIWSSSLTGYTLTASSTGALTITACETEGDSDIITATR